MEHGLNRSSAEQQPEGPRFYEKPLATFLSEALKYDMSRTVHETEPVNMDAVGRVFVGYDGTAIHVSQDGWQLGPVRGADGRVLRNSDGTKTHLREYTLPPDPDGVIRPRYTITTEAGSTARAVGPDGTVHSPGQKITTRFGVIVDGERTYVYQHPEPGSEQLPPPVDPTTAEQLVTLLYTSLPA